MLKERERKYLFSKHVEIILFSFKKPSFGSWYMRPYIISFVSLSPPVLDNYGELIKICHVIMDE